jgi:hypothetical protein
MAVCPKCAAELKSDSTICPACGVDSSALIATAKMSATSRKIGIGDAVVAFGAFMFGVTGLLYLIGYLDAKGDFSMGLLAIVALMLSPAAPLLVTFLSLKNPAILKLNYLFAAFVWLMKLTNVSVMQVSYLTKFITALDFWFVLGATIIAAGTFLSERKGCGVPLR